MTEEQLQYHRQWREKNRLKVRAYNRKYNKQWRKENGYHNEKLWSKMHPRKKKAERLAREALLSGTITKKPCEVCGEKKVHMHHSNYNKPLKVAFLCAVCHVGVHRGTLLITPLARSARACYTR